MTFYLYPYARTRLQPARRVERRWVDNSQPLLGINVQENEQAFVLSALVPGLKAEDLTIQIQEGVLRIEGEYKADENDYLLRELPTGSFARALRLPDNVDANAVEAKVSDGILTLTLPKAEHALPKRIQVQAK